MSKRNLFILICKFLLFLLITSFIFTVFYLVLNSDIFINEKFYISCNLRNSVNLNLQDIFNSNDFDNSNDDSNLKNYNSYWVKSEYSLNNTDKKNLENYNFLNIYNFDNGIIGYLSIPKINLFNVPIVEGVSQEVLNRAIGHFENSSICKGNICLAAHNRSNTVNYFNKLYTLNYGDILILKTINGVSKYSVSFSKIIDSKDWSYLQKEKDDFITCITCINNSPSKRLCVRAIKI